MERGAAARRRTGAWCSPDRSSCTPSPPRTRTMTVGSATWSACSGSGLASGARSRSYFGEFCEMFSFYIHPIDSMRCYLDMEETDGTLYLSQIPSARSRSLTKLTQGLLYSFSQQTYSIHSLSLLKSGFGETFLPSFFYPSLYRSNNASIYSSIHIHLEIIYSSPYFPSKYSRVLHLQLFDEPNNLSTRYLKKTSASTHLFRKGEKISRSLFSPIRLGLKLSLCLSLIPWILRLSTDKQKYIDL